MKKNNKSKSKSNGPGGPGRPQYEIKWPRGKFTFTDLEVENGVNPETGKGKNCTTLTLRKGLKRDLAKRSHSVIAQLDGVLAEPNSKSGKGRKQLVYIRRVKTDAAKTHKGKTKADVTVDISSTTDAVSQSTTDYEAQKAALLAPTPAVTITPEPTPATTAEEPSTEKVNGMVAAAEWLGTALAAADAAHGNKSA